MNYIKRLQLRNKAKQARIDELENSLSSLRGYLESHKFNCGDELDSYVQISDVLLRIAEAKNSACDAELTVLNQVQEVK